MVLDVNMDEGLLDGKAAMVKFLRSEFVRYCPHMLPLYALPLIVFPPCLAYSRVYGA